MAMTSPDHVDLADARRYQPGLFAAFRTRPKAVVPVTGAPVTEVAVERPDLKHEEKLARDAYDRGRRDERARHRGSPLLALIMLVVALAGGTMIYLAAREGSFARGGQVVDQTLGQAAAPAKSVAESAGNALEGAGQSLKQTAGPAAPSNAS